VSFTSWEAVLSDLCTFFFTLYSSIVQLQSQHSTYNTLFSQLTNKEAFEKKRKLENALYLLGKTRKLWRRKSTTTKTFMVIAYPYQSYHVLMLSHSHRINFIQDYVCYVTLRLCKKNLQLITTLIGCFKKNETQFFFDQIFSFRIMIIESLFLFVKCFKYKRFTLILIAF
jgi:hypothetical protein